MRAEPTAPPHAKPWRQCPRAVLALSRIGRAVISVAALRMPKSVEPSRSSSPADGTARRSNTKASPRPQSVPSLPRQPPPASPDGCTSRRWCHHIQHALPADRRIHRLRSAALESEVGLRLRGRPHHHRAAHPDRRPSLHRQPIRHRVLARRSHWMHPLDLRRASSRIPHRDLRAAELCHRRRCSGQAS